MAGRDRPVTEPSQQTKCAPERLDVALLWTLNVTNPCGLVFSNYTIVTMDLSIETSIFKQIFTRFVHNNKR